MGDERDQEVQRTPLWPPDPEPETQASRPPEPPVWTPPSYPAQAGEAAPPPQAPAPAQPNPWLAASAPWEEQPASAAPSAPAEPSISDAATMRVSAAPAISDAQTMRISATPAAPVTPQPAPQPVPHAEASFAPAARLQAAEAPTQRYTAAPPIAPAAPQNDVTEVAPAPTTPPATPPTPERKGLSLAWRLGLTALICALLLAGAGGLYAYAASLAAAPQRVIANYCAALKRDDYRDAYSMLSSSAQAQTSQAQYLADASARDTIEGPVTQCAATATQTLSPLSFLRAPRSIIFNAQITRKHPATGQIALARDATGWHVAALSSPLQGIDLGPLATEQALCKAFGQRAYSQAYGLLSTPYQHEQGDAATFARAFGDTLTVTGCTPDLKTYSVNSADQQATVDATLAVNVASATSGGAPSAFTLPAQLTFVREATGWRVDAIKPLLNQ